MPDLVFAGFPVSFLSMNTRYQILQLILIINQMY